MSTIKTNAALMGNGQLVIISDLAAFQAAADGREFAMRSLECVVDGGRYYPVMPGTPADGYEAWAPAAFVAEASKLYAAIAKLTAEELALLNPDLAKKRAEAQAEAAKG